MSFARGWLIADGEAYAVGVRRRHMPADLAPGAEARCRVGDGAGRASRAPGSSETGRARSSTSSRRSSILWSKGGDLARRRGVS